MSRVVSLGSINVDRVWPVSDADCRALSDRYDWFPAEGETVSVESLPEGFPAGIDPETATIRHGGKGANQAVAAARAGADVTLLGAVGHDHGRFGVLDELAASGVDTDHIVFADAPTGTADVFVDADGENRIVVRPGANAALDGDSIDAQVDRLRAADCLLLQNEVPVEPIAALLGSLVADDARPTVVLDPAPPAGVERLLAEGAVDYLTPNEAEYRAIEQSLAGFAGCVVHKHGGDDLVVEDGPWGHGSEPTVRFRITPPAVDTVDTTGAGDVLNGFFGARLAAGDSVAEALRLAVTAASLSTTAAGARGGIPTLDTVRASPAVATLHDD